jgi:hypothetical protein
MSSSRKDSATFVDKAPLVLTLTPPPTRTQSHNSHSDPFQLARLGPPGENQASNPATFVGPSNKHQINPNGARTLPIFGKMTINFSKDFKQKWSMDVSNFLAPR